MTQVRGNCVHVKDKEEEDEEDEEDEEEMVKPSLGCPPPYNMT